MSLRWWNPLWRDISLAKLTLSTKQKESGFVYWCKTLPDEFVIMDHCHIAINCYYVLEWLIDLYIKLYLLERYVLVHFIHVSGQFFHFSQITIKIFFETMLIFLLSITWRRHLEYLFVFFSSFRAQSLVVSNLRSETKVSQFESTC